MYDVVLYVPSASRLDRLLSHTRVVPAAAVGINLLHLEILGQATTDLRRVDFTTSRQARLLDAHLHAGYSMLP